MASILGWFALPPPVDHILSELSTMTCPSWVALHSMAHSFIELHKPLGRNKTVICEDDGMLQSMVLQRVGHTCVTNNNIYIYKH